MAIVTIFVSFMSLSFILSYISMRAGTGSFYFVYLKPSLSQTVNKQILQQMLEYQVNVKNGLRNRNFDDVSLEVFEY